MCAGVAAVATAAASMLLGQRQRGIDSDRHPKIASEV